mmetsp:Transcript_18818/g.30909  ORF Transcript_18818/g.30909 Transcript_18818/m.30909 type:complete len:480 (+) Transcript_18818:263-1702(+)|eukprot:CAMPEP_0184334538 /NCGR_PEP_ID=MMETSP1089-20130417/3291_1 /TAXON_ID=38269 ORGANISM="Gloeochaete wittrockiana, Strain SAG46.84" /NCGR_SAMPLE_ID=MMETSP1089 /ASSEMBLY_ACC=CAM_ASM_000445 /LENGTH=479 /DNA_ID=CAMNT_0026658827 /DNA_START=254 /DNA_END=1693 /DNA_ORIENTATION=+
MGSGDQSSKTSSLASKMKTLHVGLRGGSSKLLEAAKEETVVLVNSLDPDDGSTPAAIGAPEWTAPESASLPWKVALYCVTGYDTREVAFTKHLIGRIKSHPPRPGMRLPTEMVIAYGLRGPAFFTAFVENRVPAFELDVKKGQDFVNLSRLAQISRSKQVFVVPWAEEGLEIVLIPSEARQFLYGFVGHRNELVNFARTVSRDYLQSLFSVRKLPLVLDLDQTLIDAVPELDARGRTAHFFVLNRNVRVRPFVPQFLIAAHRRYSIVVCTAGSFGYARPAIAALQTYLSERWPDIDWASILPLDTIVSVTSIYDSGIVQAKDLRLVYPFCYEPSGFKFPLVVDDVATWWPSSQQDNVIAIPPFTGVSQGSTLPEVGLLLEDVWEGFFSAYADFQNERSKKEQDGSAPSSDHPADLPIDVRKLFKQAANSLKDESTSMRLRSTLQSWVGSSLLKSGEVETPFLSETASSMQLTTPDVSSK